MYKLFAATLTAVLVTGAGSVLMAQESGPGTHRGMQMMKKWDADGNGELSKDEFLRAHEAMFDSLDTNGDGTLDQEEREAMMRKMRHHRKGGADHHEMKEEMQHPETNQ